MLGSGASALVTDQGKRIWDVPGVRASRTPGSATGYEHDGLKPFAPKTSVLTDTKTVVPLACPEGHWSFQRRASARRALSRAERGPVADMRLPWGVP